MAPSDEVTAAVGAAPDYGALARKAEQLRQIVAQPSAKEAAAQELARIEQQLVRRREDEGVAAAKARLVGIRRAVGSLMNEYGEDRQGVRDAVVALRAAIETLNARAEQLGSLRAEAEALADRFGLELPKLVMPHEPEAEIDLTLPPFWYRAPQRPAFEQDEHRLRERRTYQEVDGTEGHRIILAAGLAPWPALTPEQQAVIAERAEDKRKERESMAEFAREAARIPTAGPLERLGRLPGR